MSNANSLSDDELKAILEALNIAIYVTVAFPPLENSRIHLAIDELWSKFATEAIARGLTDYAGYWPEMPGPPMPGEALGDDSDAAKAIDFHEQERFWYHLAEQIGYTAIKAVYDKSYDELPSDKRIEIHSKFSNRATKIFETEGIAPVLNLSAIIDPS